MRNSWLSQVFEKSKSLLGLSRDNLRVVRSRRVPVRAAGSSGDPVDRWDEGLIAGGASDSGATFIESPETPDPAFDLEAALLNQAIPSYEILETLDRGGQGTVYRAVQRSTQRQVALKVLHPDSGSSRRRRQRFAREVELVAGLRHPHVVTIFDSGIAAGRPYFSMELIDGLSIDDHVLLHRPTVRDCVALFEKICRAVASVHQRGVIHRDLKPGNILVDMEGEPHILDFGLAKRRDDEPGRRGLSVAGQVVGTLPFLSPEQIDGGDGGVDIRTDIHALGVILHLLLTGEMPYPIDGPRAEVAENIVERVPARLDRRAAEAGAAGAVGAISTDLSHIVLKALAKEKARRYQSADALADDLQRYLTGDIVTARGDGAWRFARVALRKYRVHSAVAAAFVLLLVGWAASTTVLWQRTDQIARDANASLQMDRDVKLGSIARDEGRIDDAIRSCENVISVFGQIHSPRIEDHRAHYSAHHDLAQIYLQQRPDLDKCDWHSKLAIQIAASLVEANSSEPQFRRLLAFANRLAGRLALRRGAFELAQLEFERSVTGFRSLSQGESEFKNAPIEFEALFSEQYLAQSKVLNKQNIEGQRLFLDVRTKLIHICSLHPLSMDFLLELIRTETLLAADLEQSRSMDDWRAAVDLLSDADKRIQFAYDNKIADYRLSAIEAIRKAVDAIRLRVDSRLSPIERD